MEKPKFLYKFYSFHSKHSLKNICNNIIYFAHPSVFEDKTDCTIVGFGEIPVTFNFGVFCVTKSPTKYMWDNFGGKGYGCYLVYDIDDLLKCGDISPVKYVDKETIDQYHKIFREMCVSNNPDKEFLLKLALEIVITKHEEYRNEEEFRIIYKYGNYEYKGIKPKSIVFGRQVDEMTRKEIIGCCGNDVSYEVEFNC